MERDLGWIWRSAVLAALAAGCATTIRLWSGYPTTPKGQTSLVIALLVIALAALGRFLVKLWNLWKAGCEHPLTELCKGLPAAAKDLAPIAAGVGILSVFLYSLTYLKSMITAVVPFWADAPLAASDRLLFIDAQALAIALGPALPLLGLFYGLWHVAHIGGILWVLHWRNGNKASHILSFMLTWLITMVLAYAFSSAGPIFTGLYDPAIAPESVRKPAAFLWANYQASGAAIGGGISAFPSLHVAIATWFALILKDCGLRWVGVAYAAAVLVCSVILGWHYLLDGVAGIAIALLADRISRAWLGDGVRPSEPIAQQVALSS